MTVIDNEKKVLTPGLVGLQDSDGNTEYVFAETTDVKDVVGPGAIDPQDAQNLLKLTGGYTSIDYGDIEDNEYSDELRDREGMVRYYKMLDDDAVRNGYNTIIGAIRSMPYYIQYASEDPVDLEAAAFVSDQLGIESSKAGKYPFQRLVHIFEQSLLYGIGFGEIVMRMVEGKATLDAVIPYHPLVVEGIVYDSKGGPKAIRVKAKLKGEKGKQIDKDIPIYKMVVFLNDDDGDMKGRSILRAAYVPYQIKRTMLKLINSGFERYLLGVPVFKAPQGVGMNSPEWAQAKLMGMRFAGNPKAGLTLPHGWEFTIEAVGSQMPDALPYVQMMNEAISRSMGIEYNGESKGAYGTTAQLVQLSERTIRTYIDAFVQYVNTYLIPKIMVLNYPDVTNYPMLTYSSFQQELSTPVLQLVQQLLQMTIDSTLADKAAQNSMQQAELAAKTKADTSASKGGSNIALNAETTSPTTPTKSASPDAAATGEFNRALYDAMVDALPEALQEQLGYKADKRKKLLQEYRTSTSTGYSPRQS